MTVRESSRCGRSLRSIASSALFPGCCAARQEVVFLLSKLKTAHIHTHIHYLPRFWKAVVGRYHYSRTELELLGVERCLIISNSTATKLSPLTAQHTLRAIRNGRRRTFGTTERTSGTQIYGHGGTPNGGRDDPWREDSGARFPHTFVRSCKTKTEEKATTGKEIYVFRLSVSNVDTRVCVCVLILCIFHLVHILNGTTFSTFSCHPNDKLLFSHPPLHHYLLAILTANLTFPPFLFFLFFFRRQ